MKVEIPRLILQMTVCVICDTTNKFLFFEQGFPGGSAALLAERLCLSVRGS